eukprot:TRINITY_DN16562_c0_g1_i1.p1 TRINITY_DN16562_c0_g1~~TRINITY_DN16562_c0_g1_i1.p1  ORF type:complete len:289 (-),score=-17.88 TRINITY_DN16562_c0_g1_i1:73-939(-)
MFLCNRIYLNSSLNYYSLKSFSRLFSVSVSNIRVEKINRKGTSDYRMNFMEKDTNNNIVKKISPWHDIPLIANSINKRWASKKYIKEQQIYNFVCEIPAFTRAKMEISTEEEYNPMKQDIKNEKVRFYHGPIYWNYGFFPQTWEDPTVTSDNIHYGDNDPLDVVEVGSKILNSCSITPVIVLGGLELIDCSELDYKIIVVNVNDPLVTKHKINNLNDLEIYNPHTLQGIREWFRWYKTPDGKPLNKYASETPLDKAAAEAVISETNQQWKKLVENKGNINGKQLWTNL